ncbi:hypothetical protein AMK68_05300, partial [candidate division KD3-62 bacterium DG_56]
MLACNLVDEQGQPFVQPYVIKAIDGTRVVIIGVFFETDARIRVPVRGAYHMGENYDRALKGLQVLDPVESTQKVVDEVDEEGTVIIVLSQLRPEDNVKLAEAVPSI